MPDGPGAARRGRAGRPLRAYRRLPHRARLPRRVRRGRSPARCRCSGRRGATCTSSTSPSPRWPSACTSSLLALKKNVRWLGLPLVTTVLLDLGLAVTVLYTASDQLVPALHSYWLYIHVSTAIFCGAVFYVGAVGTLLYLFKDSLREQAARTAASPARFATSVLERLPASASLDKFSYRVNAAVFPLWTFTIIAGAIWAGDAWGRYWGWDPKEIWSFITWVAYACYLHARATAGWKGRKAAYLALIAFGCWLFNYYGVNIFVTGKHSTPACESRSGVRFVPGGVRLVS